MSSRPSNEEILARYRRTGETPTELVDALGLASDRPRDAEIDRVKKLVRRERDRGGRPPPSAPAPPAPAAAPNRPAERPAIPPGEEVGIPALRRQLADLQSDLQIARSDRSLHRLIQGLSKRESDVRAELERALEVERKVVRLDPTPAAICAELERRAEAIALRAELHRRRATKAEEGES